MHLTQLSPPAVRNLSDTWVDDGSWNDVLVLANRFLAAQESEPMAPETQVAWHHLAVAIGNFKRPGGRIHPGSLPSAAMDDRPKSFVLPLTGEVVHEDDEWSWVSLGRVRGLGVVTASALLAAVWPTAHVIVDRRAISAAVGLRGAVGDWSGPFEWRSLAQWESKPIGTLTWSDYKWFRECVLETLTALQVVDLAFRAWDVERALYKLDQLASRKGQTWEVYSNELHQRASWAEAR